MTTTEENMENHKLKMEKDPQEEKIEEKNENIENNEQNNPTTESEPSSPLLKPKILIPIIIGAIIVIVIIIVLIVVLTKDDDDDDERWKEAYKKAKKFLKSFSYEEKYRLFYGDYNVSKTCVGGISPISERGFPGICLQDGPAGVRPSDYTTTWNAAINLAATFNRDLVYEIGKA